jgi:flagellar motility protein MotE (MotC chaperone)
MSSQLQKSKVVPVLIGIKLIVMTLATLVYFDMVQIGDKLMFAEESAEKAATNPADDKAESKPSAEAEAASKRKSFLNDLFELPKLDAKSAKKEEIGKYLDLAEKRGQQLLEREKLLKSREETLISLEKSIDEKLKKIDEERKYIAKTLQDEKDLKGERLERLLVLYDKMEPKKAAPQIEKLDKDLVVALFKGLKQKQVTLILEMMSPEKSVELTEYFGRVKSGREYDLLKELNESMKKEFDVCKGMPTDKKQGV